MTPFTTLVSVAAPLFRDNVDTDAIIPSREIRSTGKNGLADGLFAPWRYLDPSSRIADPGFVLNQPQFNQAAILLSGANFGCGSSREHAVWALVEWGIRCIVAESFAPIFYANCIRNGVLPVVLRRDLILPLAGRRITVDLGAQTVDGVRFEIGGEARAMLLDGLDAIDLTFRHRDAIARWQAQDQLTRPWIYLEGRRG